MAAVNILPCLGMEAEEIVTWIHVVTGRREPLQVLEQECKEIDEEFEKGYSSSSE